MKKQRNFIGKIVTVRTDKNRMEFYWIRKGDKIWLYGQKYSASVHKTFKNGVTDYEFRKLKWGRNPKIDKTKDKIPVYIAYVQRQAA